jgi:hypothetical protein
MREEREDKRALLLGDHRLFRIENKGPATEFAAVILFAGMNVTIFLEPVRTASGTYFSRNHRACSSLSSLHSHRR